MLESLNYNMQKRAAGRHTWAMLLIGFVGIGFAANRTKRSYGPHVTTDITGAVKSQAFDGEGMTVGVNDPAVEVIAPLHCALLLIASNASMLVFAVAPPPNGSLSLAGAGWFGECAIMEGCGGSARGSRRR
jgi:hypothetical protein